MASEVGSVVVPVEVPYMFALLSGCYLDSTQVPFKVFRVMGIHISYPLVNQPVVFEDDSEEDESQCIDVAQEIHAINVEYCKKIIQKREISKAARELFEVYLRMWASLISWWTACCSAMGKE
ncbi:hypothetical protein NDU88_003067 [Pleurodeles waltl]|uniref:Uncharacterized protein n=1 Tax=Pleurodeles waltl TaxID=8319 RepID=A0AAV7UD17_PLEWA|nr:hypothetical protein NDU88_003067 [Pleurodeles waltl]